jgi:hypothetical protein
LSAEGLTSVDGFGLSVLSATGVVGTVGTVGTVGVVGVVGATGVVLSTGASEGSLGTSGISCPPLVEGNGTTGVSTATFPEPASVLGTGEVVLVTTVLGSTRSSALTTVEVVADKSAATQASATNDFFVSE